MMHVLPWFMAVLSGLSLALAMPGPGLGPLAFLFPVLLLEAIERGKGRWRPWLLGLVAGTVFWAVSTNWVVQVMHHYGGLPHYAAVNVLLGMALVLGLFWAVATGLTSLVPKTWRLWFFPPAWIAILFLHRYPPLGFTWTGAASAFVDWPWLMDTLPVWGASGLGWWVVAIGAGFWGLLRDDTRLGGACALAVALCAAAAASLAAPQPMPAGEAVRIAVLQPGTSLEEKWDPSQARVIADRLWAQTGAVAIRGADVVLWPESAVPYRIDNDPTYREAVELMARELDLEIVLNSVAQRTDGGFANSAHLVTPEGLSPVRYDKMHLVPFGEFVPGWAQFAATESLVREVGGFKPGREPVSLPARAPLGVAICFEVVFPSQTVAQVRGGAEILTTLTNDGWYGFSWAPQQHFAQVRLRAAESRRWFVRAALTGISAFVDPSGRVVASLDVGENGFLVEDIQPMNGMTPRVRWGDWWVQLCAIATGAMVVESRLRRRRKEKDEAPRSQS